MVVQSFCGTVLSIPPAFITALETLETVSITSPISLFLQSEPILLYWRKYERQGPTLWKEILFSLSKICNAFLLLLYCQIRCSYCGYNNLTLAPRAPPNHFWWHRMLDQEYTQHILDTQSLFLRHSTFKFYFITPWLLSPFYNSLTILSLLIMTEYSAILLFSSYVKILPK